MRPSSQSSRVAATIIMSCLLIAMTGCVTAPDGSRKFDPWNAAKQAEQDFDGWVERKGGIGSRPAMWE